MPNSERLLTIDLKMHWEAKAFFLLYVTSWNCTQKFFFLPEPVVHIVKSNVDCILLYQYSFLVNWLLSCCPISLQCRFMATTRLLHGSSDNAFCFMDLFVNSFLFRFNFKKDYLVFYRKHYIFWWVNERRKRSECGLKRFLKKKTKYSLWVSKFQVCGQQKLQISPEQILSLQENNKKFVLAFKKNF